LVSFTQIDQYLRCPLQIPIPLYRRLEPDVVPAARAFGSGIHAAAAVLFRNVAHGERQRVEGVQGCFERFSNLEVGRQPLWYGEKLCQT
jgi:hypothetical protein